jgi:hypothetical protein
MALKGFLEVPHGAANASNWKFSFKGC